MVLGLGDDLDPEPHQGVVEPAELGALPEVRAGALGADRELVEHAGQRVAREVERVDVEAVDHVRGAKVDVDVGVDRELHHRILGGLAVDEGVGAGVGELPSPLEGQHVDGDVGPGIRRLLVLDHERAGEQGEDDDDGNDGVDRLERDVVLGLLGDVVALAAVAEHGPDDQQERDAADDHRADGEPLPEVEHGSRARRGAGARAEGGHGASRKGECGYGECNGTTYSPPSACTNRRILWGQGG